MKKRLLALLLCLVMVIGLVPTVFAGEVGESQQNVSQPEGGTPSGDPVEKKTRTVRFDPVGGFIFGEESVVVEFKENETTTTLEANGKSLPSLVSKDGYKLAGWYENYDAQKNEYTNPFNEKTAISYYNYDKTVYAKWEEDTTTYYTVTYTNPNTSEKIRVENFEGGNYELIDCPENWIPENQVFVGWKLGDATYKAGTEITISDDTELTAVFGPKVVDKFNVSYYDYYKGSSVKTFDKGTTIYIDPNDGVVTYTKKGSTAVELSKKTAVTVDTDITLSSYYNYNYYYGYSFAGWKYDSATKTFTAQWTKDYPNYNTYSIYYYDYDDCKSEYANFPYGTSVVIDPNGGTAKLSGTSFSTKQSFNIYRDYTLTDASRSGYTFYGWDLTKSGSTYYFTAMWSRYKSDVPYMLNGTDHYAYIKGYPNGSFKPTDTITRAEAATIFYRLLTDSTRKAYATTYNSFKDVPATAWYNTAVSTMAKLGIVNGGADGYFRPNDPITRAEIAAMIARCDGAYYTGSSTVFSDTYGHWAASYIARAYELGWINGYGTTYAPDRYISRAETVAVLNRVLNRAPQYTSDLTRNYTTFSDVATSAWYYLDVEEAANSHTYTRKSNADYETWTKLIADPSWF